MEKYRQIGALQACRQMYAVLHMFSNCEYCLVCPWAGAGGKPPPPPKAVFKKYLENVHSLSGLGVRCLLDRLARIAAEDTVVLQQRGREGM